MAATARQTPTKNAWQLLLAANGQPDIPPGTPAPFQPGAARAPMGGPYSDILSSMPALMDRQLNRPPQSLAPDTQPNGGPGNPNAASPGMSLADGGDPNRPSVATPFARTVPGLAGASRAALQAGAKQTTPINAPQAAGAPGSPYDGGAPLATTGGGRPVLDPLTQSPVPQRPGMSDKNFYAKIGPFDMQGRKEDASDSYSGGMESSSTQAIPDADLFHALGNVVDNPTPGMRRMRKDVDAYRGALGDVAQGMYGSPAQRVDMMPLMQMSDFLFHSNFAPNYTRPVDDIYKLGVLGNNLLTNERGLGELDLNYLGRQLQDHLGTKAERQTGNAQTATLGAGGGMMNPMQMLEFMAGRSDKAIEHDRQASEDAGKALGNTAASTDLYDAMEKIDEMAHRYKVSETNQLPGTMHIEHAPDFVNNALHHFANSTPFQSDDKAAFDQALTTITREVNNASFGARLTAPEIASTNKLLGSMQGKTPQQQMRALLEVQKVIKGRLKATRDGLTGQAQQKFDSATPHAPDDFNFDFGMGANPPARKGQKTQTSPGSGMLMVPVKPKGSSEAPAAPYIQDAGGRDPKIDDYAIKYKIPYEKAAEILTKRGYKGQK